MNGCGMPTGELPLKQLDEKLISPLQMLQTSVSVYQFLAPLTFCLGAVSPPADAQEAGLTNRLES